MDLSNNINLNKDDLIIYNKNKLVVIYNKKLSRHIILSEEVYNFFKIANKDRLTIKEFINCFEDKKDREYMEQVIINMIKAGVINHENYSKYIDEEICVGETIYICLTKRCNLKCKHCCATCSIDEKDFLNTEQIRNVIDIAKSLNAKYIILTGGEPLIRNDFKEITSYIRAIMPDVYLILSTNGILINDKNIDFIIKNFNKIDISIDGVDEETCSQVRGSGVFSKVVSVVKKLQEKEFINISLSMIFGDKNAHLREQFKQLNKSLNTISVERSFSPEGRGLDNISQFFSENTVLDMNIINILKDKNKKSRKISSCACNALKSQIFINYDGNIYPCPSLIKEEYNVGSIFDEHLIANMKNKDLESIDVYKRIRKIYPYNFERCKSCDVNIFCWHCPAALDAVKYNEQEFNKWCSFMKNNLNRIVWDEGEI